MSNSAIEIFVLLSLGLSVLGIRICVRRETGYGRKLALDNYFTAIVVVSIISPPTQRGLTWAVWLITACQMWRGQVLKQAARSTR